MPYIGYKTSTSFENPIPEKGAATTITKKIPFLYGILYLLRKKYDRLYTFET